MIPHPARHFIYFLISRRSHKTAEILTKMGDLGLPLPTKEEPLKKLVSSLLVAQKKVSPPSGISKGLDTPQTAKFLDTWKIADLWKQSPDAVAARRLLTESAEVRRSLEIMLLGPIAPKEIADRIQRRYGLTKSEINSAVVRLYGHYFWNTSLLTKAEMVGMIDAWAGIEDRAAYMAAYMAPRSASGVAVCLMYADRSEDELDPIHTYTTIRNLAFKQFMEVSLTAHPNISFLTKAQSALLSLQTMKLAEEELVKVRGVANNAFLAQLARLETKHDHVLPVSARALLESGSMGQSPHGQVIDTTLVEDEEEQSE